MWTIVEAPNAKAAELAPAKAFTPSEWQKDHET